MPSKGFYLLMIPGIKKKPHNEAKLTPANPVATQYSAG